MDKNVKECWEAINQGLVPNGYKKTKVGIIPEDWKVSSIRDFSKINNKKYYPGKDKQTFKCIELEHIEKETGALLGCTNTENVKSTKNIFSPGDILYGKLRPYLKKYYYTRFKGVCSTEIWVLKNIAKKITTEYLYLIVQTPKWNYLANISIGSSMPRADWEYMQSGLFPIPPLEEQERIADILSTWDRAIGSYGKLLEEKKERKKGLMQVLLTGEKRLGGFTGPWKEVRLGEVSNIVTGTTPSTENKEYFTDDDYGYPWITPTDISNFKYIESSERKLTEKGISNGRFIPKNSLLITCIASIGKNVILKVDGSCNQQINAIYPSDIHSNEYLYYYLTFNKNMLLSYATTTATTMINKSTFESMKVTLPSLEEQKAIAEVLSTADREIDLLDKLIEELEEEKKGLMQVLLTGIVRV